MRADPQCQYVVVWEFHVRPEFQSEFAQVYGPDGEWVQLFRNSDNYLRTELLKDENNPHRYVTIDVWRSRQDYEIFRHRHVDEYRRIDERCEQMTEREEAIGTFETV